LRIFDVEPIVPVESKAKLVLDSRAPVLGGASGVAAVDDAFRTGRIRGLNSPSEAAAS
jgi:hypothetical protein